MINHLVLETNRYACSLSNSDKPSWLPSNRPWPPKFLEKWVDVDIDAIKNFIAIVYAMGIIQLPNISSYWRQDWLINAPGIAKIMKRERFEAINSCLSLYNVDDVPEDYEKEGPFWKIRLWLKMFKTNCEKNYCLGKDVSLDEQIVISNHITRYRFTKLNKPISNGFKFVVLSSTHGVPITFEMDKKEDTIKNRALRLCKTLENKGHCVYMDNFYSSYGLYKSLLEKGIYACGTVRTNRGFPKELKSKNCKLELGEYLWKSKGGIVAYAWMDSAHVTALSSYHNPNDSTTVKRWKKGNNSRIDVNAPKAMEDYNEFMGGNDIGDALRSYYTTHQKSRKWWKSVFFYSLDNAMVASYIVFKELYPERNITHLEFIKKVCEGLIGGNITEAYSFIGKRRKSNDNYIDISNGIIEVGHFPEKIEGREQRCVVCYLNKKEKGGKTRYRCKLCQVNLHPECFEFYDKHTTKE